METKTSLEMYRIGNCVIRKNNLYYTSQDSALLFEASAGCLRTKSFERKYIQNDETCVVCRKETETNRRILLEFNRIHPNPCEGNIRLPEAPGFKGDRQSKLKHYGGE